MEPDGKNNNNTPRHADAQMLGRSNHVAEILLPHLPLSFASCPCSTCMYTAQDIDTYATSHSRSCNRATVCRHGASSPPVTASAGNWLAASVLSHGHYCAALMRASIISPSPSEIVARRIDGRAACEATGRRYREGKQRGGIAIASSSSLVS